MQVAVLGLLWQGELKRLGCVGSCLVVGARFLIINNSFRRRTASQPSTAEDVLVITYDAQGIFSVYSLCSARRMYCKKIGNVRFV